MSIKPTSDRILLRKVMDEQKTSSGIILSVSSKEKPTEGIVEAVGPGKINKDGKYISINIKVNQKVVFAEYTGTKIEINGEEKILVREDDILAIIE